MENEQNSVDKAAVERPHEWPIVLVAEDDEHTRWLICSELKTHYVMLEAENGQDALEMAMEYVPDLLVTDIMMPLMDGIELCRAMKKDSCTARIPVIMLTARATVENQIEGFETGADAYITKPFENKLLKARIDNLLQARQKLEKQYYEKFMVAERNRTEQDILAPIALENPAIQDRQGREFWERLCFSIQKHYRNVDFSIHMLADDLGMSARSMQRKMKTVSDRTPVQLIADYRLQQSLALIHQTSVAITDIAYDVGFANLSHFYRLFKKEFGKTPVELREEA